MKRMNEMELTEGMVLVCMTDEGANAGDLTPGKKYEVVHLTNNCTKFGIIDDAGDKRCSKHCPALFVECPEGCGEPAFAALAGQTCMIGDKDGNLFIIRTVKVPLANDQVHEFTMTAVIDKSGELNLGEREGERVKEDSPKRCMSQLPVDTLVLIIPPNGKNFRAYTNGKPRQYYPNGTTCETYDGDENDCCELGEGWEFKVISSDGIVDHDLSGNCAIPEWVQGYVLVNTAESDGDKSLYRWEKATKNTDWYKVNAFEILGEVE